MSQLAVLWRQADFRWLFISQALSTLGDRIVQVALALLIVNSTGSSIDLGLVIGAQTAVLVTFLLLGGVWADRLPRHRIMVTTDLARGGLHALLAVLIFTGTLHLWHLLVIEVAFGAAEAFFRPAYSGLLPQTVDEDLIQDANAASSFTAVIAAVAGPVLATGLVLAFGPGVAFAVDAATFFVSASLLSMVQPRRRGRPLPRASVLEELRAGYREVRSRPWVWVTIVVASLHLAAGFATYMVAGPLVAKAHGAAAGWGWLVAGVGLGTACGSVLALRLRPRRPLATGFIALVPFGLLLVLYAGGLPGAVVLPFAVVAGAGIALFNVWWATALAQQIPSTALSRVTSYDYMGSHALYPLGAIGVGILVDRVGAASVLTVGGCVAILLAAAGLLPRGTRELTSTGATRTVVPPLHDAA